MWKCEELHFETHTILFTMCKLRCTRFCSETYRMRLWSPWHCRPMIASWSWDVAVRISSCGPWARNESCERSKYVVHLVQLTQAFFFFLFFLRYKKEVFPVLNMDFDPTGTLVAMGCGDGSIKVYDADQHYYTHHFSSAHTGKIQVVKFHPQKGQLLLFTSGLNGMKCWNLETRT